MRRHIATSHRDVLSEKRSSETGDPNPKPSKKPKRVILGSTPKEDTIGQDLSGHIDRMISRNKAIIEEAEKAKEVPRKSPSPRRSPRSQDEDSSRDGDSDEFEESDKNALGFNNFISTPNPGKSLFSCPYCWYSTDLRDYFHVHLKRHHVAGSSDVQQYPCPLCRFTTDQIMGLTMHLNKHQVGYSLLTFI